MTWLLFLEQCLNGLQFGLMLFLLAAGLTWWLIARMLDRQLAPIRTALATLFDLSASD